MLDAVGIGKRITAARESAGFSKAAAEKVLLISRQTLTAWEKGDTSPGINDLSRLCRVFDCDFGYIIGEYEERTRPVTDIRAETGLSPQAIEALKILNKYSEGEELRIISDMIVFTVKDAVVKEFAGDEREKSKEVENILGDTFFQALNNLIYQFKLLPVDGLQKAGYMVLFQRLFNDFIEEQLKKPLPIDRE